MNMIDNKNDDEIDEDVIESEHNCQSCTNSRKSTNSRSSETGTRISLPSRVWKNQTMFFTIKTKKKQVLLEYTIWNCWPRRH